MGKADFRSVSGVAKCVECPLEVGAAQEEVEVLRVANDSRVLQVRVRAAHQKRHVRVTQDVQCPPVKGVGVATWVVESRLRCHSCQCVGAFAAESASPGLANGSGRCRGAETSVKNRIPSENRPRPQEYACNRTASCE